MDFIASPQRLIISAIVGFVLLLFLIIKCKFQPIIAILLSSITIGIATGMPFDMVVDTLGEGVGNTLSTIAPLIGLGSMFGAILQVSGGVEVIADTFLNRLGEDKAAWALGVTGLTVGMPVFFESGLLILIPLALGLADKTKRSVLFYAIPLLAGLAVGHTFIPPTPGPVLVADMLGTELGYVIGLGFVVGIFVMIIAGPIFGGFISKKIFVDVPESYRQNEKSENKDGVKPPFALVVFIILFPLLLILLHTASKFIGVPYAVEEVLSFLGTPVIALLLSTLLAMFLLGYRYANLTSKELQNVMTNSLKSCGNIILLIACGGTLRYMLQNSGLGEVISNAVSAYSLPMIAVAFIIAAAVRVAIGSATVSMTMAAGIIASMPIISEFSQIQLAAITMAIASGATVLSHVNDSGFWLFKSLFNVEEKVTLKTWTVMETIIGVIGLIGASIIWVFV